MAIGHEAPRLAAKAASATVQPQLYYLDNLKVLLAVSIASAAKNRNNHT